MGEFRGMGDWLHQTNIARQRYALAHPDFESDEDDRKALKYRPGQPRDENGRFSTTNQFMLPGMRDIEPGSLPAPVVFTTSSGRVVGPGAPEPIMVAARKVNPPNQQGQRSILQEMNCQYCTAAYELRRRGYDVQAVSHTATRSEEYLEGFSAEDRVSIPGMPEPLDFHLGMTPFNTLESMDAPTRFESSTEVFSAVQDHISGTYPVGSRGSISYQTSAFTGHVFNWENTESGVVLIDAQEGKPVSRYADVMQAMTMMPETITTYRLDNCDLTPKIGGMVT